MSSGHSDQVALFQRRATEMDVEGVEWVEYRPVSQMGVGSALEFHVPATSMQYLKLDQIRLQVKAKITKADGTTIVAANKVGLVNLSLQSLFSQVDVSLQQQPLYSVGINYAYKAIFDTLLNYGGESKRSQFSSQLYYHDTSGNMDDATIKEGTNAGFTKRCTFTEGGKTVDLEGPLYLDICQQDRMLLNGVSVNFKLWPTKDTFRLMCKYFPTGNKNIN